MCAFSHCLIVRRNEQHSFLPGFYNLICNVCEQWSLIWVRRCSLTTFQAIIALWPYIKISRSSFCLYTKSRRTIEWENIKCVYVCVRTVHITCALESVPLLLWIVNIFAMQYNQTRCIALRFRCLLDFSFCWRC